MDGSKFSDRVKTQVETTLLTASEAQRYFTDKQNALKLDEFLNPQNLNSTEFRRDGFSRLDELEQLLQEYRLFYSKFVVSSTRDTLQILSEGTESELKSAIEASSSKTERNMYAQAIFFNARQKWIDSARKLLSILEENSESIVYDEESFLFEDDTLLEEFVGCVTSMDEAAEIEKRHISSKSISVLATLKRIFGILR